MGADALSSYCSGCAVTIRATVLSALPCLAVLTVLFALFNYTATCSTGPAAPCYPRSTRSALTVPGRLLCLCLVRLAALVRLLRQCVGIAMAPAGTQGVYRRMLRQRTYNRRRGYRPTEEWVACSRLLAGALGVSSTVLWTMMTWVLSLWDSGRSSLRLQNPRRLGCYDEGPQNVVARGAGYETLPTMARPPDPLAWVPKGDWCGRVCGLVEVPGFYHGEGGRVAQYLGGPGRTRLIDSGVSWHWSLVA
jgi:hypothetical protein